ncbi:MAG TPA: hypothetical protein VFZ91_11130 [Allosphingosinicella sp.]
MAVSAMVDAVNRGDFAAALAAFTETPVIVEDIAPFRWQGAGAPSAWLAAMGANAARLEARSIKMTLGQATRIDVEAGSAYALFPGGLSLATAKGDLVSKGILTLTLNEEDGLWLIDTLVWSGPETAPR